jgi:hypothetical protein
MKQFVRSSLLLCHASAFIHLPSTPLHLRNNDPATVSSLRRIPRLQVNKDDNYFYTVSISSESKRTGRNLVVRGVSSLEKEIVETETNDTKEVEEKGTAKSFTKYITEKMGTVDEERLAFPEIVSGEVPRFFSNISYKETVNNEGKITKTATHVSGSVVGAAALIAGTTIGAGVLALPTATAPAGFLPSSAALCVAWFYMTISGLLIAELSINRMGETGKQGVGLLEIYKSYLGDGLGSVGSGAYFFLHYAVMVAYLSQGGANLGSFLDTLGFSSITAIPGFDQILFASMVGSLIYFARDSFVEKINNVLVLGVIGTFMGIIATGAQTADFNALVSLENQHPVSIQRNVSKVTCLFFRV